MALKKRFPGVALFALTVICLFGAASSANASLIVTLQSGSSNQTLVGAPNSVLAAGLNFAGYNIAFLGASSNSPGIPGLAVINVNAFSVTNTAGTDPLVITVFSDGFTTPNNGSPLTLEDQLSITGDGPGTVATSISTGQGLGIGGTTGITPPNTSTTTASGQNQYSSFLVGFPPGTATFSLTQQITLNIDPGSSVTVSGQTSTTTSGGSGIANIPEPASLALMSGVLSCWGYLTWRGRRRVTSS